MELDQNPSPKSLRGHFHASSFSGFLNQKHQLRIQPIQEDMKHINHYTSSSIFPLAIDRTSRSFGTSIRTDHPQGGICTAAPPLRFRPPDGRCDDEWPHGAATSPAPTRDDSDVTVGWLEGHLEVCKGIAVESTRPVLKRIEVYKFLTSWAVGDPNDYLKPPPLVL